MKEVTSGSMRFRTSGRRWQPCLGTEPACCDDSCGSPRGYVRVRIVYARPFVASPDSSAAMHLTVIVPAYNEAVRIQQSLCTILSYLAKRPEPCEVIVVDDGSLDDTARVVRKLAV